jgi:hypothetical protein
MRKINWKEHAHLFTPGRRADDIAAEIGCCRDSVYRGAKDLGFRFDRGSPTAEEKPENRRFNYLEWVKNGCPEKRKPLE